MCKRVCQRLFLILFAGALLLYAGARGEGVGAPPDGYSLVAQNETLSLYLRRDIMAVIVEDNATGARLYSAVQNPDDMKDNKTWKGFYQSDVVIEYIEGVNPSPVQADFLNAKNTIDYTWHADGFTALVRFTDIGIGFEIDVRLDESGLHVAIPQDSIEETMSGDGDAASGQPEATETPDPDQADASANARKTAASGKKSVFHLGSVSIFPFLGHSFLGQDAGYMLIPDGQGAAITLQNNEKRFNSAYERYVYGDPVGVSVTTSFKWYEEPERILMPVFGMVHSDDHLAFLGVIEEGDACAKIMAYPNGVVTSFDWIGAKFIYREIYNQPTVNSRQKTAASSSVNMLTEKRRDFDILLHFFIARGEEADYTGLARRYGEYLKEKGSFLRADRRKTFDMNVEFMGMDQENALFGKSDVAMTTFADARTILADLSARGAASLTVSYIGWQKGGATGGLPVTGYTPAPALGGKEGMNALRAYCESMGMDVSLSADFLTLNLESNPLMTYDVFKKITGETWEKPTYKKVYSALCYLQPGKTLEFARNTAAQLARDGFRSVTLTGFPGLVSDYTDKKTYRDSTSMMSLYSDACEAAGDLLSLRLAASNAYLWRYAGALSDMPMGTSDYLYAAYDVPFMAIALSGNMRYYAEYTNFQANNRRFFLQLIEQGAFPSFLITRQDPIELINSNSNDIFSSQYDLYRDMLASYYAELSPLYERIGHSSIIDHERRGDMIRVERDNGLVIYLNYGAEAGVMDGVAVPGLAYKAVTQK